MPACRGKSASPRPSRRWCCNGLRGRIAVQADGGLRTGRDVAVAAILGADEFGFATAPLIAAGCIMMRKCHLNTCPVGIATQDPVLRARFTGTPEHVINYFFFVAEELREIMASLGIRTLDEMIGRTDLIDARPAVDHWKAKGSISAGCSIAPTVPTASRGATRSARTTACDTPFDRDLIAAAEPALERREPVVHRTPGPQRAPQRRHDALGRSRAPLGHEGLPQDSIFVRLNGTAGQSFGAFLAHGVTLELTGDGNDYVGKGLSGGRVIVRQPEGATAIPRATSSSATPCFTAPSPAKPISRASPASASLCATPARSPWSKAPATIAANI